MNLILEANENAVDKTTFFGTEKNMIVMMTPAIDEEYWLFRVKLDNGQAINGFPKFGTIGIGFAIEENWNINLPFTLETEDIFKHIRKNRKPSKMRKEDVCRAIKMVQDAASAFKVGRPN